MLVNAFAPKPPAPFNVKVPATVKLLVDKDTPPEEFVIDKLLNELAPELSVWAAPPLNVTVPLLCVNVPELVKLPLIFNVVGAVNVPAVMVNAAAVSEVVLPPTERVLPNLLTVMLLNV